MSTVPPRSPTAPLLPLKRRPRGWGRAVSARRVRHLIAVEQSWERVDGTRWWVAGLYRPDSLALLEGEGERRLVGFAALGREYRRVDGGTAR